jgi:transposase InsO family protein
MSVVIMLHNGLSLRKALAAVGSSQGSYYHKPRLDRRDKGDLRDPSMLDTVRELALMRPVWGTRMIAAYLSKDIHRPVSRKLVQHAFHVMGWTMPQMTKKQILRAKHRVEKPTGINQLWEADLTYIFSGVDGWCYLFNILDCFSREWIAYVFDTLARKENAIQALVKAVEKHPEAAGKVKLRCDNGPQFISDAFVKSTEALGVDIEFIAYNTPEQNGNVESFHGRFKKEYVWTNELNSFQDADKAIAEAFIDYNQVRPHSSLGYLSPYEFISRMGVKVD